MSSVNLQGLGESNGVEYVLQYSETPLPRTRDGIVAAFETILNQERVQKVIVEVRKPIKAWRAVPKDEIEEAPKEEQADDLWTRLRNGRISELDPVQTGAQVSVGYVLLFVAFDLLSAHRLRPRALFVRDTSRLKGWLGIPPHQPVGSVFGVAVEENADVPFDAVFLVGMGDDEFDSEKILGIRIPVDMPKKEVRK